MNDIVRMDLNKPNIPVQKNKVQLPWSMYQHLQLGHLMGWTKINKTIE